MAMTDIEDRRAQLDAFAAQPPREHNLPVVPAAFSAPAERVFGAQPVAVRRDEAQILGKLRTLAAAAGESWYYRYPVRKKVKDEQTGKESWVTDYIEGPSIKLANDLARLYGNLDIDVRIFDMGEAWVIYARLMDLETGFAMTRPFQQRKGQKAMRTDDARALDIALQIGVSKAIRNVVCNGLQTFADFAFEEARDALVNKVSGKLDEYRARVLQRLDEMKVEPRRAELVVGRAAASWLAPDVARLIAMIKSIADGMASVEETFPPIEKPAPADAAHDPQTGEIKQSDSSDQRAADENPEPAPRSDSRSGPEGGSEAVGKRQASELSESGGPPSHAAASEKQEASTAAGAANDPRAEGEYVAHAMTWIDALTDPAEGERRWKEEKNIRNRCNVAPEVRDKLTSALQAKIELLKTTQQVSADPIATAKQRGAEAYHAGHSRKAVPGEYRTAERQKEADAWWAGFDAARAEDDQRAR